MKITCDRQELLKGIQYVQNTVSSRATLPILSNILLKAEHAKLTLAGTDLEVGVICHIPVSVEEEGGITLPAKKFGDIIKELSESEVVLHAKKNNMVSIECGKSFLDSPGFQKKISLNFRPLGTKKSFLCPKKQFKRCFK